MVVEEPEALLLPEEIVLQVCAEKNHHFISSPLSVLEECGRISGKREGRREGGKEGGRGGGREERGREERRKGGRERGGRERGREGFLAVVRGI